MRDEIDVLKDRNDGLNACASDMMNVLDEKAEEIRSLRVSTNWQRITIDWQRITIETKDAEIVRLRATLAAKEQAQSTVDDEYVDMRLERGHLKHRVEKLRGQRDVARQERDVARQERDARVTVEEANRYGEWMLNKYNSTVYWSGILAWRTRPAVDGGGDGKDEGGGA